MAGNVYNNISSFGVSVDLLVSNKDSVKERYVDIKSRQHLLRVDYEMPLPELDNNFQDLSNYDAIIISDYNKGTITKKVFDKIINNFNGLIFIDSKKQDLTMYNHKNCILKINEQEYKNAIIPKNSILIVTLGDRGAMKDNKIYQTKKVEVFDVSGAGDSFMAGLVIQYLLKKNFEDAIMFANVCAANVVTKTGTAIIDFNEVKRDLCF